MEKVFSVSEGFEVPDGTIVHSVLDPRLASFGGSAWVDETSLAVGVIPARISSKIHVHPFVTQVTWVVAGRLSIRMKDSDSKEPYTLALIPEQAVVTQPGTFFQLINKYEEPARALYIVTPAFLFEADEKGVHYNDAIVLEQDWDELEKMNWKAPQMRELSAIEKERVASKKRLKVTLTK